jgi:hypothetical protein
MIGFKKLNTVGELKKVLKTLPDSSPIYMYSDEEGNEQNKILAIEVIVRDVILVPWQNYRT